MATITARLSEVSAGYAIETTGLRLLRDTLTRAAWLRIGEEIARRLSGAQWAAGDWINAHRGDWGDTYTEAMRVLGVGYDAVGELSATARHFDRVQREAIALSFSHFRIARCAPEPMALLRFAEAHHWSCRELEAKVVAANAPRRTALVAAGHRGRPRTAIRRHPSSRWVPRVTCPQCAHTFPIQGHRVPRGETP